MNTIVTGSGNFLERPLKNSDEQLMFEPLMILIDRSSTQSEILNWEIFTMQPVKQKAKLSKKDTV